MGFSYGSETSKSFDVSDMTIRRDLTELEKVGLIRRTHGGAVNARGRGYEPPLALRSIENKSIKERIGHMRPSLSLRGTVLHWMLVRLFTKLLSGLKRTRNITIVTPSIPIASLFFDRSDVRLILPGGIVRPGETSLIGDIAQRTLKDIFLWTVYSRQSGEWTPKQG